ncbi:MAG TPA: helix-turn-helix domain-containing protein [Thermoanaerobaculia bacterium]|jgi:AcrR family transcriptional regulator|nr:helix-turn-helix domain-containing protein [Thermoanaerobaculia bacterium]
MTKPRTRLGVPTRTAVDWEEAALDMIAAGGLRSVAIPSLAGTLGVTKGSFYWHFSSLEVLIAAALARWEAADQDAIAALQTIEQPAQRLKAAFEEAMQLTRAQALYVALTATPDEPVTETLKRVSRRRINFLAAAFRQLGLEPKEARARALLTYTAYLGAFHLRRQSLDVRTYVAHAARTLIP